MKALKVLLIVAVLMLVVVGFVVYAPYGSTSEKFVEIMPGTGTVEIAQQLRTAGVIRSAMAFEAMKALHGGTLKAGEYKFDHASSAGDVYERMQRGDVFTVTLVIPEGYNIFDVAQAVQTAGLGSRDEFLKAEMQHADLVRTWNPQATSVEGFLFPDTYKFGQHATPVQILTAMVKRFATVGAKLGISKNQSVEAGRVVTLASLVEREVHVDAERSLVAGVFQNRLAMSMPLQTDPAVQYASLLRGTWTGVIHQSELQSDSPYNTYTHEGLPPGPICNPGIAALKAALHPAKTEYLYFVADAKGATRFSTTVAEHNQQVAEYRLAQK